MTEFFNAEGTVQLVVNGQSKGQVQTGGKTIGEFVRNQAQYYGLKSFSVYVDGVKFYTENAGNAMTDVTKVELVAKDSRGGSTWSEDDQEDWFDTRIPILRTNKTPQGAPKLKLNFDRKALIASLQKTVDTTEAKYTADLAKFKEDRATVSAFIDSQAETLAKRFGFKTVEAFNESRRDRTINDVASVLGLPLYEPNKPNNSAAKAQLATLALASDESLEIEEGHHFITHLK